MIESQYPAIGTVAPDFVLHASDGRTIRLANYRDREAVVIFFYSKAMTLDSTLLARGFRERYGKLRELNAEVLGISPDPPRQLQKFVEKHGLSFPLLADEDHVVAKDYAVWRTLEKLGQEYKGTAHTSFVVDQTGRIVQINTSGDLATHADTALQTLETLKGS
jgi:peroxiredoxin Q/BCP